MAGGVLSSPSLFRNVKTLAVIHRWQVTSSVSAAAASSSGTPLINVCSIPQQARRRRWLSSSSSTTNKPGHGNGEPWKDHSQLNGDASVHISDITLTTTKNLTNSYATVGNRLVRDDTSYLHPHKTTPAQAYENRHASAHGVGFNIRSGPVPINQTARAKARERRLRRGGNDDGIPNNAYGSLMDPFYVPQQSDQTHLIQGGTPCDPKPPPYRLADYGEESVYTLILLRHGESEWNSQNRYTGWCDVNLTKRGESEARAAGRLLYENGIEIDHAFTSVLKRASFTTNMCLNMARQQ